MIFDDDMADRENKRLMDEAAEERNYQELYGEWCSLLMEPQHAISDNTPKENPNETSK